MMAFLDWRSDEVEEEKEERRVLVAVRIKRAIGVLARENFFFFFWGAGGWGGGLRCGFSFRQA